jgi:hypothetical protein
MAIRIITVIIIELLGAKWSWLNLSYYPIVCLKGGGPFLFLDQLYTVLAQI